MADDQDVGVGVPQAPQGALPATAGDTAAAAPQWGQSLSQDIGNVAGAFRGQGAIPDANNAAPDVGTGAPGTPAQPGQDPASRAKAYITRQGAMPQQQYQQLRQQIEQSGVTDPNDITAHAIVKGGPAALQATAHYWDAYRGSVGKAITDGNLDLAASEANKAFTYIPDGTKAQVSVGEGKKDFKATVHGPDGSEHQYQLAPEELAAVVGGKSGFFDHIAGSGVANAIDRVKNQNAGGPTSAGQSIPQPPASSFPGNVAQAPQPSTGNQAPQNAGAPGVATNRTDINKTLARPGGPAQEGDQSTQAPNKPRWVAEQGGIGHWEQNPTYNLQTKEPRISVTRAGQTTQYGNTDVGTPEQQKMAQALYSNNPPAQAQWIANENQQSQTRGSAERIAQIRGPEAQQVRAGATTQAAETRANAVIQAAQIKAQSVADGTDTRFNGETDRTTANLVASQMKADAAAGKETTIGSAMQALRAAGLANPSVPVLQHIFNPQSQAPQRQARPPVAQPQVQGGEQTATNQQTGEKMVYRGGKWIPLQ